MTAVEQQIQHIFQQIAFVLDVFAGFVIVVSAFLSAFQYLAGFFQYVGNPVATDDIRLRLGKSLSFGLEFLVAADIVKTLITPTLSQITILAATVAIRITLNFFLERESARLLALREGKPVEESKVTKALSRL